jgi:hypothetical protein
MKKVKLIRDYNGKKKGEVIEVTEQVSYFMLMNSIAVLSDCSNCEECEDCKGSKKKKKTKSPVNSGDLS